MAWNAARDDAGGYLHPKKQQRILAAHGHTCYLCGHSGGTLDVDHIVPWAEWTRTDLSVHDASNLAPAHATPCPTCSRDCHTDKTKAEAARGRARKQNKLKYPARKHPGLI